MKAMVLAAGRGERLRPLTDTTPKPLLVAGGKPLIVWHLERLAQTGFDEIVINHAHLGAQLEAALGDGHRYRLRIRYAREPAGALETAGGIAAALPLLGEQPFLVVNGDIWCDWDFARARELGAQFARRLAHLVLVDNPPQHAHGDFCLHGDLVVAAASSSSPTLTYAGIGVFRPDFFAGINAGQVIKLRPLLDDAIARGLIGGERHAGRWVDVGTPDRLITLDRQLQRDRLPTT